MRLLLELQGLLPVREEEHAREERGGHQRLRVLGPEGRAHRRQELPELRRVVGLTPYSMSSVSTRSTKNRENHENT